MTIRLDRRQFLMGSSALLAAGAAGINPAFAQAGLRQFFWGGQNRADRTYAVNDLFTAANGAPVDSSFLGWGDYWPKLATETAGGNAPDIVQMDYRYIVEYAKRNAIAPLDDYVGGALKLDGFDADQLEGGKVDGALYGISLGANSVAQLVNLAAFEEAGIEPPNRDTTYDDIRAMGEAFNKANVRGGIKVISDGSGVEPMLDNWLRQKGLALYTADGKLGFGADEAIEWFALWDSMRKDGICVDAETQALDTNGPLETTMVVMGKSAMMPSNSNQLVAYQLADDWPNVGTQEDDVDMAGSTYHWQADIQTSPDPAVRRVDIRVFSVDPDGDSPADDALLLISGFLTQHPEAEDAPDTPGEGNTDNNTSTADVLGGGRS